VSLNNNLCKDYGLYYFVILMPFSNDQLRDAMDMIRIIVILLLFYHYGLSRFKQMHVKLAVQLLLQI
jgi:hypothetical protein